MLLAEHSARTRITIDSPQAISAFLDSTRVELERALTNPILIHGSRTQLMFEMLVTSLGKYAVFRVEDHGRLHSKTPMSVPDFRLIHDDGTQWLIEVKNTRVSLDKLEQPLRIMKRAYWERLKAYAAINRAHLKLAVFWSGTGTWTLLSPEKLVNDDGEIRLSFLDAIPLDELGQLGDRTVGTEPPLRLRLLADSDRDISIGDDGAARFTIKDYMIFSNDREIQDQTEKEMAWFLINYGEWKECEPTAIVSNGSLEAIEFRWEPIRRVNPDQRFEIIGRLSRMLARYYAEQTVEQQSVVQLIALARPDWIDPFLQPKRKHIALPLWQFALEPSEAPVERA